MAIFKNKIKVIYIASSARSGSTLLGNLLSQKNGFVNVGELCYIWDRGVKENWLCNCGKRFNECDFWGEVLRHIEENHGKINADKLIDISFKGKYRSGEKILRYRNLFFNPDKWFEKHKNLINEYLEVTSSIYKEVQRNTNSLYIVDSSKRPEYAFLLSKIVNIKLYVIHLVRDPRAVLYSQTKRHKKLVGPIKEEDMVRKGGIIKITLFTIFDWVVENILIKKIFKKRKNITYKKIKYEEFVKNPMLINYLIDNQEFIKDTENIFIKDNHSFSGNPNRFNKKIEIKEDNEWRKNLNLGLKIFLYPLKKIV